MNAVCLTLRTEKVESSFECTLYYTGPLFAIGHLYIAPSFRPPFSSSPVQNCTGSQPLLLQELTQNVIKRACKQLSDLPLPQKLVVELQESNISGYLPTQKISFHFTPEDTTCSKHLALSGKLACHGGSMAVVFDHFQQNLTKTSVFHPLKCSLFENATDVFRFMLGWDFEAKCFRIRRFASQANP